MLSSIIGAPLFCALPVDKVAPTPFQRDLSAMHAKRLTEVIGNGDTDQPFVEHTGPARIVAAHLAAQAVRRRNIRA